MSSRTFPSRADELTADWLTGALRSRGLLTRGTVSGFDVRGLSEPGQTADLFRIALRYEGERSGAPDTLIAKLPAEFEGARALAAQYNSYEREVRFYRYFWDTDLPIPLCYAADMDASAERFVLLLEDLGQARNGSLVDDSPSDVERGLRELAKIHARFWRKNELARESWIRPARDSDWIDMLEGVWAAVLPPFKARYERELSPYTWSVAERWLNVFGTIQADLGDAETLLHVDAHPKQMFFPTDACDRFAIFDWQVPGFGPPAGDVSRLIVCGLGPDNRRRHEERLLEVYLSALHDHGVDEPTRDRLRFGVRTANLWNLFIAAVATLQTDIEILRAQADDAGKRWEDVVLGRVGSAIDDWQTLDALEQLVLEAGGANGPR